MPEPVNLKRSLSLYLLVFYGLGNILGAGIYVLIGKVVGVAGIYAPISFIIASLLGFALKLQIIKNFWGNWLFCLKSPESRC